jgi:hypothetical protein
MIYALKVIGLFLGVYLIGGTIAAVLLNAAGLPSGIAALSLPIGIYVAYRWHRSNQRAKY